MSDHRPRVRDKIWDGQVKPQPNGAIVWIDWADHSVVVEFLSSPPDRKSYAFDDILPYWDSKYNLYRLNEADFEGGFHLDINKIKPPT
jgi:hypothetical protein